MKLSEKGLKSFADQMLNIAIGLNEKEIEWDRDFAMSQVEFEPDDFTNCVMLTVEEAKRIMLFIEGVNLIGDDLHQYIKHIFKPLKDGIEQAEGKE